MSRIVITLKSDLCAASGKSFSSVVDSDIATDRFGLPYIPARRVKGCLRDAALYIYSNVIDELFGESGKSDSGSLKIGSGYLEDREALEAELSRRKDFSSQRVTELFSSVKAQTAIEGDTAKDNSLRFTRVLSHYLPYDRSRETKFVFDVTGISDDKKTEFERICKALRHIGLMRTRGLGFVSAEYQHDAGLPGNSVCRVFKRSDAYYLPLHLLLTEPLLIASKDNTECVNYVPGTAVLGAFARLAVLSNMPEFDEVFLSGKVCYGNLYISDKTGTKALPAPHFMRKLKSTDETRDGKIVTEYDVEHDNFDPKIDTPKTLKNKYVDSMKLRDVIDVATETQYHHTRVSESGLYTQDSISAGQYLYGEVESADKVLLEKLAELLASGDFRLGRSRTAQYSGCKLLEYDPPKQNSAAGKSGNIVYTLESDVVLMDEGGVNTVDPDKLKKELGIPSDKPVKINLAYKIIHGYNSKRNMRNIPVVAFGMGSTVTVNDHSEARSKFPIGARQSEGFGKIRVFAEDEIRNGSAIQSNSSDRIDTCAQDQANELPVTAIKKFLDHDETTYTALREVEKVFEENAKHFSKSGLNAAFVGAVSRMIETAENSAEALDRISKVKDDSKRNGIKRILEAVCREEDPDDIKMECMLAVLKLAKYRLKLLKKDGEADE